MSIVFIVSAPSGSGKSTLVRRLLQQDRSLRFSVSYTTRPQRGHEQPGVDYHYISRPEFEDAVQAGEFLEWADVFGNYYGTSADDTGAILGNGEDLVLVIDVQGARQVCQRGVPSVGVFVLPPSAATLEERLRGRSKDSQDQIRARLEAARREVGEFAHYDYVVINDRVDTAVERLRAIVLAERARTARMRPATASILATFAGS
jgi:guanylate kinase